MSKLNQAMKLFNENVNVSRKDFIIRLVNELKMNPATASVYHHKCRNEKVHVKQDIIDPVVEAKEKVVKSVRRIAVEKSHAGIVGVKPEEPIITENKYVVKVPEGTPAFLLK